MKMALKLLIALLLLAVVPVLWVSRYATTDFHGFTKRDQEQKMADASRVVGELFRSVPDAEGRRAVIAAFAKDSGRRHRFFNAAGEVVLDEGDVGEVDFAGDPEVQKALQTGEYAARWWLHPDRSRLYYFVAVPILDADGECLGVAQTVEDTREITEAVSMLHQRHNRALIGVSGASAVFALVFALGLTRRLRQLRRAARDFAHGGEVKRFEVRGRDEVSELAADFREMAQDLKARQAYNRDFVLTTLHELKTPLTAIHGAADLLATRSDLGEESRTRFAHNIQAQSDRLMDLVMELQTLTSLDVDLPGEAFEVFESAPWLEEVLDRLRPGLRHAVDLDADEGQVRGIPPRLEQGLINLLQNADRYHVAAEPIRVVSRFVEETWSLEVIDRGAGISPENLSRIFDRYFTTSTANVAGQRGRGLGLAVLKRIVEHHGGEVTARNRADGGAAIGFRLPCRL
jgi:signal transduction histidine kinase